MSSSIAALRLMPVAAAARESADRAAVRAEVPELPKPATPASVAVHMARVPSSQVLAAFVAMQREVGRERQEVEAQRAPAPTAAAKAVKAIGDGPASGGLHFTA